jgi:hypothetical protein
MIKLKKKTKIISIKKFKNQVILYICKISFTDLSAFKLHFMPLIAVHSDLYILT